MSPVHPDEPEARAWLQANANESALATNRFGTTAAALQFVEQLYGSARFEWWFPANAS